MVGEPEFQRGILLHDGLNRVKLFLAGKIQDCGLAVLARTAISTCCGFPSYFDTDVSGFWEGDRGLGK